MTINMDVKSRLEHLSKLTYAEIGASEENVKQKIVVPLLEIFGHNRNDLDFEYGSQGKRIDIFIKGLPVDCKIVIDTKNYNEDLSNHLEQIGLYAFQEGAILALIVNGEEIRIYDPYFRGYSIRDSLLFSIKREELADDKSIEILKGLLLKDNILNKSIKQFIIKREGEIQDANNKIESLKNETLKQIDQLQSQIKEISLKIDSLKEEEKNKIESIRDQFQLNQVAIQTTNCNIQRIEPQIMQAYRKRNIYSKSSNIIEIVINSSTPRKFHLIPCPKQFRHLFPGYNLPFVLETDIGEIPAKVTSAPGGTRDGDPNAGNYIKSVVRNGLTLWYGRHADLKLGDTILIEVIEPQKRYSLSIK